ncbi:hypothetical protein, partial [Streptomyces minutiscleroticus]|uniref:hypothetical protein n=1 Tax=Streptomyces minutiscleroticus TaxID=68238 RepID=UPI00332AA2DA
MIFTLRAPVPSHGARRRRPAARRDRADGSRSSGRLRDGTAARVMVMDCAVLMRFELMCPGARGAAVNTFPGLVHTARHVTKVGNTRSRWPNP